MMLSTTASMDPRLREDDKIETFIFCHVQSSSGLFWWMVARLRGHDRFFCHVQRYCITPILVMPFDIIPHNWLRHAQAKTRITSSKWIVHISLGARQTGKASYLKANFKHANYYDLLDTHEMLRFTKAFVIWQDKRPRDLVINSDITLHILPWDIFLTRLWSGKLNESETSYNIWNPS